MNKLPDGQIPEDAKFVIYLYPNTGSTMQQTLFTDKDKTRDSIRKKDLGGYSYGVKFKNNDYEILPYTYIIRAEGGKKDLLDLLGKEYNIEDDLEQAEASRVLAGTDLTTYIKANLHDTLIFLPFDPVTTVIAADEKPLMNE